MRVISCHWALSVPPGGCARGVRHEPSIRNGWRLIVKIRLLLVISLVMGIVSVTAPAVRADVLSDLGFQLGGSTLTLPPAQVIDPPPQGAANEPLFNTEEFTCSTGAIPTPTTFGS